MQNFEFLRQPLLGELAMSRKKEREKEREKMPFIVATYVYASSQGQRTHSAQTKIRFAQNTGHFNDHRRTQSAYNLFNISLKGTYRLS